MKQGVFWLFVALSLGFLLFPVFWQLRTSLTPENELGVTTLLPGAVTLTHFRAVLRSEFFLSAIKNSLLVAIGSTVLSIVIGSLASFALVKLGFKQKRLFLLLVLSASMFPTIGIVSPLYICIRALGLRDTLTCLIFVYTTFSLPLTIWILSGFFETIPDELISAARTDGCNAFQIFRKVVLPLSAPGVVSTGLLVFIFCWNEFLLALTFTATSASRTVPVAISLFPGLHEIPWGEFSAASIVVTVPVAILVLLFQRRIVSGLTAGGIKG